MQSENTKESSSNFIYNFFIENMFKNLEKTIEEKEKSQMNKLNESVNLSFEKTLTDNRVY